MAFGGSSLFLEQQHSLVSDLDPADSSSRVSRNVAVRRELALHVTSRSNEAMIADLRAETDDCQRRDETCPADHRVCPVDRGLAFSHRSVDRVVTVYLRAGPDGCMVTDPQGREATVEDRKGPDPAILTNLHIPED